VYALREREGITIAEELELPVTGAPDVRYSFIGGKLFDARRVKTTDLEAPDQRIRAGARLKSEKTNALAVPKRLVYKSFLF
jgi:hypothetical protein